MIHLDLFSGIGGFAYAADKVFGNVEHIFCDNDKFCQQVLKMHWPESEIYDDIRSITADPNSERQLQQEGVQQKGGRWTGDSVDILTGGFPCQPFSAAGLRRGTADDRHLWPEMLRVIQLTQPTWVIAENVRGILTWNEGLVFEQVCTDLEASGYEVQPFIIPAVAVNAPHRRDRVWFVAHRNGPGLEKAGSEQQAAGSRREDSDVADTERQRQPRQVDNGQPLDLTQDKTWEADRFDYNRNWGRPWPEIAAELCSLDDGLPAELGNFTLTKAGHRQQQLKAYGNAIVPQVAIEILKGIKASGTI